MGQAARLVRARQPRVAGERDAATDLATWSRYTFQPTPWISPARRVGARRMALRREYSRRNRKAFLWVGVRGHVEALLNGEKVMEEETPPGTASGNFELRWNCAGRERPGFPCAGARRFAAADQRRYGRTA